MPNKKTAQERVNPLFKKTGLNPVERPANIEKPEDREEVKTEPVHETKAGEKVSRKPEEEKAVNRQTVIFTDAQLNKLLDLETEYRRRTGKKTNINKIIRLIVDKTTIEDLL